MAVVKNPNATLGGPLGIGAALVLPLDKVVAHIAGPTMLGGDTPDVGDDAGHVVLSADQIAALKNAGAATVPPRYAPLSSPACTGAGCPPRNTTGTHSNPAFCEAYRPQAQNGRRPGLEREGGTFVHRRWGWRGSINAAC